MFYKTRADLQTARKLGEHLLTLAQRLHDPERLVDGHSVLGEAMFSLGKFVPARAHLAQVLATLPAHRSVPSPRSFAGC